MYYGEIVNLPSFQILCYSLRDSKLRVPTIGDPPNGCLVEIIMCVFSATPVDQTAEDDSGSSREQTRILGSTLSTV